MGLGQGVVKLAGELPAKIRRFGGVPELLAEIVNRRRFSLGGRGRRHRFPLGFGGRGFLTRHDSTMIGVCVREKPGARPLFDCKGMRQGFGTTLRGAMGEARGVPRARAQALRDRPGRPKRRRTRA